MKCILSSSCFCCILCFVPHFTRILPTWGHPLFCPLCYSAYCTVFCETTPCLYLCLQQSLAPCDLWYFLPVCPFSLLDVTADTTHSPTPSLQAPFSLLLMQTPLHSPTSFSDMFLLLCSFDLETLYSNFLPHNTLFMCPNRFFIDYILSVEDCECMGWWSERLCIFQFIDAYYY